MGQCYVRLKVTVRRKLSRGRRRYRHKRHDYAPQRSWRYKDAQVLNQISLRGAEYDSPVWELEERGEVGGGVRGGGGDRVLLNPVIDEDSEEEEGGGEIRSGGRLVFAEPDEQDTPLTPPTEDSSSRVRSASNSSQKIGRFEVCEVQVCEVSASGEDGEVGETDISEMDTTQLLGNQLS